MHLLIIHQAFASPDEPGGTRHYELARHLIELGHRVTIVASDLSYLTGKRARTKRKLIARQELNGVRILRVYTFPSLHRSFFWRVVSFVTFMVTSVIGGFRAGSVDLVMGTSPPIFQAVSAWLVSLVRRRPFLLEVRDLWPEFAIDLGVLRNRMLIALSRRLEAFLYSRARRILVNSPAYRDYLVARGIPETKIRLIPNGSDPDMFNVQGKGERIREELGLNGQFVVSYTGALGLANDIPTILRAADRVRDDPKIHFLLVGDGKERASLESLTATMKLSNVTFTGARPKFEMAEILAASDACLATLKDIPMFRTTYPNKVFDYMAASRPTILAIDGVIRRVMEAAQGGIVVSPGDDAAIAEAVRCLSENPAKREQMGRAARAYAVAHFNRHKQASEFVELLTALLSERAGNVSASHVA
jgi:glycosyltransferase involved in cell wall biosynthesis